MSRNSMIRFRLCEGIAALGTSIGIQIPSVRPTSPMIITIAASNTPIFVVEVPVHDGTGVSTYRSTTALLATSRSVGISVITFDVRTVTTVRGVPRIATNFTTNQQINQPTVSLNQIIITIINTLICDLLTFIITLLRTALSWWRRG